MDKIRLLYRGGFDGTSIAAAPTDFSLIDGWTQGTTLVPGFLLFAPMAGLLAYRSDGREELAGINAATKMRFGTPAEDARVTELDTRYVATTAGAVALGVTGAALVVTGAVLLATGRRANRVAVAPWAGRGIGGLVLRGRF